MGGKKKAGRKGKGRDLGYTLAASSCEGASCVEYAPSRPLMRSLLSQFQTPTTPRRAVGFFGSGCSLSRPSRTDHPAYFGLANVYFSQPFQPSTGAKVNTSLIIVNADYWCKLRPKQLQTQRSQVVEAACAYRMWKSYSRLSHNIMHSDDNVDARHKEADSNQKCILTSTNAYRMLVEGAEQSMSELVAYVDGGSLGNPGPLELEWCSTAPKDQRSESPSGSGARTTTWPNTSRCSKPCNVR